VVGYTPRWSPNEAQCGVQFSSVQFARINVVLSAKALQDHDTVTKCYWRRCRWKRNVFGSRRNEDKDGAEVTLGGSAFHARAPATGNARSPSEDRRVAGTTSVLEAEGSRWRE